MAVNSMFAALQRGLLPPVSERYLSLLMLDVSEWRHIDCLKTYLHTTKPGIICWNLLLTVVFYLQFTALCFFWLFFTIISSHSLVITCTAILKRLDFARGVLSFA